VGLATELAREYHVPLMTAALAEQPPTAAGAHAILTATMPRPILYEAPRPPGPASRP